MTSSTTKLNDLRETALAALADLERIADRFPMRSPGRVFIRQACRSLKLSYVATRPDKLRMLFSGIDRGYRRFSDILKFSGLERSELEDLLADLTAQGFLRETRETPHGDGRGRPVRIFEVSKNK